MQSLEEINKIVEFEKKKYTDYFIHEYRTGDKVEIYRDSETGFFNVTIFPVQELDFKCRLIFPFLSYDASRHSANNTYFANRKTLHFNTARLNSISPYLYNEQKKILGLNNFNRIRYISIEDIILLCKRILAHYYKEGGQFKSGINKRKRKQQEIKKHRED